MFAGLYIACKETCHRTNVFFWNGTTATQKWGSEANPEYQCSMSEGSQSCSAPKPGRNRETTWADSPAESRKPQLSSSL